MGIVNRWMLDIQFVRAIREGNIQVLKQVLQNDYDSDARIPLGHNERPAICLAAEQGNYEIVQVLCSFGANVFQTETATQNSPLHLAVSQGHIKVVRALIEEKADPSQLNGCLETPIHIAAKRGNPEILRLLLQSTNAKVNVSNIDGYTALMFACHKGNPAVVKLLLNNGADPFISSNIHGSALLLACGCPYLTLDLMDALLAKLKTNPHRFRQICIQADNRGYRCIHYLVRSRSTERNACMRALLEAGCDPSSPSFVETMPIHFSVQDGDFELTRILILYGSDVNGLDYCRNSPLFLAARSGQKAIVKLLLDAGAQVRNDPMWHDGRFSTEISDKSIQSLITSSLHRVKSLQAVIRIALRQKPHTFSEETLPRSLCRYLNFKE